MAQFSKKQSIVTIKLGLILFSVAAVTVLVLSLIHAVTADKIEANQKKSILKTLENLVQEADSFLQLDIDGEREEITLQNGKKVHISSIWLAKNAEQTIYACVRVRPVGYMGDIDMIAVVSQDLEFVAGKIISFSETPGIGTKIQDDQFINRFIGKSGFLTGANEISDKQTVQVISRATVSSEAFIDGVNAALAKVSQLSSTIFKSE